MAYAGARVDRVLVNVSDGHYPEGYICDQALTPLPVLQWTGIIAEYGDAHRQLLTTRVRDRGEYQLIDSIERSVTDTYVVENHGLKDIVTERAYEEVEAPFEARVDVVKGLKQLLMNEKEFEVANLLTTASNYPSGSSITLSGTSQFNDFANSTPLQVIANAQQVVLNSSGVMARSAIIPEQVLYFLRAHPTLTGIYGYTGIHKNLNAEQVREALGLDEILVPYSNYVNASGTTTFFWGKDIILFNRAKSPMKRQRTFGYKLIKKGHESRVFIKDNPSSPNGDVVFHDMAYKYIIRNSSAGYIIKNAVA